MTTPARGKLGGFCFRCSAPDPRHDAGREPASVYTPWPMLAPANGLAYARTNPLIRTVYAPADLGRVVAILEERKDSPRPVSDATEDDLDALRGSLIWIHEFGHLYFLEWTSAKELARTYLALSYDPIIDLLMTDRLSDQKVGEAWRSLQSSTQHLAQIEESIAFVEELVATAIAFTAMERQNQPGGMWVGFDEEVARIKLEFVAAEEEFFDGFGRALAQVEPLIRLTHGNPQLLAFLVPLLQPAQVYGMDASTPPRAIDARAHLDTILERTIGCENAAMAMAALQELEPEALIQWKLALGLQIASARDVTGGDSDRPLFRKELAQWLWRVGRGDYMEGLVDDTPAEAADRAAAAFRAYVATGDGRLGLSNLVLLQPRTRRNRRVMNIGWWVEDDAIPQERQPEDLEGEHFGLVVLEGLREQLLTGHGIVCPKNPEGISRCDCPLSWRKALLRLARLGQSGAFGPGEWSPLPCRRR